MKRYNSIFILIILFFFLFPFSGITQKESAKDHYVGEFFGGGVIYYLYLDANGEQHGLIASLSDLGEYPLWGFPDYEVPNCNSSWDGASNTRAFIAAGGKSYFAIGLCATFENESFKDWYMPSIDEFNLLFNARFVVNKVLEEDGDPSTNGILQRYYWSSSQQTASHAWYFNAGAGFADDGSKNNLPKPHVRAIRSF